MSVELQNILNRFPPIDLKDTLEQAALLEREDTKFLVPLQKMAGLLQQLLPHYQLLKVKQVPINGYKTIYFDTADLLCYRAHHAGKLNRVKFRIREYLTTKEKFLETKFKSNKGLSFKTREQFYDEELPETLQANSFPGLKQMFNQELKSTLEVSYQRITLVSNTGIERVTLDFGLIFACQNNTLPLEGFVIAEVKRLKKQPSKSEQYLKQLGIRAVSISKYCLGMALMHEKLKANQFKPLLKKLKKNCNASLTNNP